MKWLVLLVLLIAAVSCSRTTSTQAFEGQPVSREEGIEGKTSDSLPQSLDSDRKSLAEKAEVALKSGNPDEALLSARAAEQAAGIEPEDTELHILQARALFALNQSQAATSLLLSAASEGNPQANAVLGVYHIKEGRDQVGLAFLEQAANATSPSAHPSIFADYALALLAVGFQDEGLRLAEEARGSFLSRGDPEAAAKLEANLTFYRRAVSTRIVDN